MNIIRRRLSAAWAALRGRPVIAHCHFGSPVELVGPLDGAVVFDSQFSSHASVKSRGPTPA